MNTVHTSVLLKESIDGLDIHEGDIYLDGTLGGGGHAVEALKRVSGNLTVIGLDRDDDALARSREILKKNTTVSSKIILEKASYGDLDKVLDTHSIVKVQRIMLDLGLSSDQFESSGRGFTFQKDEPLLMTFSKHSEEGSLTAATIVNNWDPENIADIIYGYGGERYARRIAAAIALYRTKKRIETTHELVEIVQSAVPGIYRRGRLHPATRTFQALRITVNDELGNLKQGVSKGFARLDKGGRMAVISFHSLEDRIVKHFYKEKADEQSARLITKKPIEAGDDEIIENPRSRSAKLRIIEKII